MKTYKVEVITLNSSQVELTIYKKNNKGLIGYYETILYHKFRYNTSNILQLYKNVAKFLKNKCCYKIIENTQDDIIRNIYKTLNHKNEYKYYGRCIYSQYYDRLYGEIE